MSDTPKHPLTPSQAIQLNEITMERINALLARRGIPFAIEKRSDGNYAFEDILHAFMAVLEDME